MSRRLPATAIAARLAARTGDIAELIHIAATETRAEETAHALAAFAPEAEVILLPPWDCLPYDRVSPSRESMGRRMAALHALLQPCEGPRILVASVEAILQRVPPRGVMEDMFLHLSPGAAFDRDGFDGFVRRAGYLVDDRIDEPGEVALRSDVIDIFPAHSDTPVRLVLDEGRLAEIRAYDPLTQRTAELVDTVWIGPASELVLPDADAERRPGAEHNLSAYYDQLDSVFSLLPAAALSLEPETEERRSRVLAQIEDGFQAARDFGGDGVSAPEPPKLYLGDDEWQAVSAARSRLDLPLDRLEPVPRFPLESNPRRALGAFASEQTGCGRRVLLCGTDAELRRLARAMERTAGAAPRRVETWREALDAPAGALLAAPFDLAAGFVDDAAAISVVTATDAFGGRVAEHTPQDASALLADAELRVGDVVIHEDHGVGVLTALERIEVDGTELDAVRLAYHGGASLLVPVDDFGKLWRYGAEPDAVTLDRLHTDAWAKRRAEVSREIGEVAQGLVETAKARLEETCEPVQPPRAAYARFAARFPFPETPDQRAAIEAVLEDLKSGRPMNKVVCGDVGFGKTEVAVRAAAAVALSGRQVAVVAPTTVLVRQHLETFRRRFSETGIEVAQLSRLLTPAEAKAVKQDLAEGRVGIVIATHAVAAEDVRFADLGLMIVDEEHRFGARFKQRLRALGKGLHTLSMSATPIPRTLQSVLVGVQDVSVLATPPARRRPVRTFLTPFDGGAVRTALLREKRREGQSFFVVPRIEDIEGIQAELARLVPELSVAVAHGDMPAREVDETMVAFANGAADILLATNIIETGLDVPRANTMFIWRADRFGLSQLHQLRGRVGRGRTQAVAYLLLEPGQEIAETTRARLSTLEAFDRLGSGLEISARDLDIRGAGDLLGEEQAGHLKLIGVDLYQQLLRRAVQAVRGEGGGSHAVELRLGLSGFIPESYVPEAPVRINLYSRLLRMDDPAEVAAFADELDDRFGELPEPVRVLLGLAEVKLLAGRLGIARIDAGPKAIALSFADEPSASRMKKLGSGEERAWKDGRLIVSTPTEEAGRLDAVRTLLASMTG